MKNRRFWTILSASAALGLLGACSSSTSGGKCPAGDTCTPSGNDGGTHEDGSVGVDSSTAGFDSGTGIDSSQGFDTSSGEDTSVAPGGDTGVGPGGDTGVGPGGDTGTSEVDSATGGDTGTIVTDSSTVADSSHDAADTSTGGTCPDNTPFTALAWAPPTPLHQGACTAAEISAWVASQSMTTGLGTSGNAACDACIATPETASNHGPIVTETQGGTTGAVEINVGGCVAREDGVTTAGSCGNQLNSEDDCITQECGDCSDFGNPSQNGPTATCENGVLGLAGACAAENITSTSACGEELDQDGGADQTCLSITTLQDFFTLWCGGPTVADAGGDSGLTCPPESTSSYTAPTYVPAVEHQNVCNTSAISAFVSACGDNGTVASCNTWLAANVQGGEADGGGAGNACGNCIFAPMNNGGAWVDPESIFFPNYAGCVQLTDATHGTACAGALNDVFGCDGVACDNACPANATSADYDACISAANSGSCSSFASSEASSCATDVADGGALGTCSPGAASGTLDPDFTYIVTLICGN